VVAVLLNDRPVAKELLTLLKSLKAHGVHAKLLYSRMGKVQADDGTELPVAGTFAGSPSLTVDAVIVPGGDLQSLSNNGDFHYYLLEAYKHLKPILLAGDARQCKAPLQVASQGKKASLRRTPSIIRRWMR
jgi:catalase